MGDIEGLVSDNLVRTKLFWCNVCCRIFGLILVIGFMCEEIGPNCVNPFIILFRSTYGFVDELS